MPALPPHRPLNPLRLEPGVLLITTERAFTCVDGMLLEYDFYEPPISLAISMAESSTGGNSYLPRLHCDLARIFNLSSRFPDPGQVFDQLFAANTVLAYQSQANVLFALYPGETLGDQVALAGSALEMELNACAWARGFVSRLRSW